jgi:hypothetical protein
MSRSIPPAALLRKYIKAYPDTGQLVWLPRPEGLFKSTARRTAAHQANNWNSRYAGTPALGSLMKNGYRIGAFLGVEILAHRAMWCIVFGAWPEGYIDHINGDRSDNRIRNLRDVDQQTNMRNARISRANTSGCTGVHFHKATGKWQSHITVSGRTKTLGMFEDFEDAVSARKEAEALHGFHVNHGRPLP